jgi:hypothetical protein
MNSGGYFLTFHFPPESRTGILISFGVFCETPEIKNPANAVFAGLLSDFGEICFS